MVPSKKRAVIPGEPICWRFWATDLSGRNEEKWFPRKKCGGPLANPTSLAASRRTGSAGRHEEKWFLRKKYRTSGGA